DDDESHHAGIPVLGRISHQRKPADHLAVYDVFHFAAGRGRALFGENLEIVAIIRCAAAPNAIAARCRLGYELAKWARLFALRCWPVEAVFLAGPADDTLRINIGA